MPRANKLLACRDMQASTLWGQFVEAIAELERGRREGRAEQRYLTYRCLQCRDVVSNPRGIYAHIASALAAM